jgi:hypothetical protein
MEKVGRGIMYTNPCFQDIVWICIELFEDNLNRKVLRPGRTNIGC